MVYHKNKKLSLAILRRDIEIKPRIFKKNTGIYYIKKKERKNV
jgi:hypothetical protein